MAKAKTPKDEIKRVLAPRKGRRYIPKFTDPVRGDDVDTTQPVQTAAPVVENETASVSDEEKNAKLANSFSVDGEITDIWERRMENPDGVSSPPVRIKQRGLRLRWINLAQRGRYQRARYEQGWSPVHKGQLVDEREIYGVSYTSEGYVCRGERQTEMLMQIPEAVFRKIMERRVAMNRAADKHMMSNMTSAGSKYVADKHGSRNIEQASKMVGEVKMGRETVSSDELFS